MPPPPSNKRIRRKRATPRTRKHPDDVWERTLQVLRFTPLNSSNSNTSTSNSKAAMAGTNGAVGATPTISNSNQEPYNILDLPSETLKDIFRHATNTDLLALSLVCKKFRIIAAEQLYRSFHIIFPDDEDPASDNTIDGLASGLDTFVTSEFDYAKYLKEIALDTQSGGDKGERAYRYYLADASCGKFMNTLFLLTLRKAKALETLKWNIRVELSRPVFKALHQIPALQHLHIRMQVGPSIYTDPPALPFQNAPTTALPFPVILPPHPPGHFGPPPPLPPSTNSFQAASKAAAKLHQKNVHNILPAITSNTPTLSGFKNLKSISILDMDTLDYVDELKACIENSSSTLQNLRLSFSEALANKSRKPPPEVHSDDDSDQEDEFGPINPPGGPANPLAGASDPNGPTKIVKAIQEKKKQEAVITKLFTSEKLVLRSEQKKEVKPSTPKTEGESSKKSESDPRRRFLQNLAPLAAKIMGYAKPGSDKTPHGLECLAMIEKASKLFLENVDQLPDAPAPPSVGSSATKETPVSSNVSNDGKVAEEPAVVETEGPGLFDDKSKGKQKATTEPWVSNPDDFDIEEPEVDELFVDNGEHDEHHDQDQEETINTLPESFAASLPKPEFLLGTEEDQTAWIEDAQHAIEDSQKKLEEVTKVFKQKEAEIKAKTIAGQPIAEAERLDLTSIDTELKLAAKRLEVMAEVMQDVDELNATTRWGKESDTKMSEYVRDTRGLTLHSLAIYLVPIRASILSRGIDLHVLQSIALLNVGPQIPFWNIITRETKTTPLPLHKVHTDNVTLQFLVAMGQLDSLTELLMLERGPKPRVESTAAKSTISLQQIRLLVLKKHAPTLKVLMVRNDSSVDWDLDVKTIKLLCGRAKSLEELACCIDVSSMHTLLQCFSGLTSLRVFHTIAFRNGQDQCPFVMVQFRRFLSDIISQQPQLKVEYVALDSAVDRLVRHKLQSKDKKGKGKSTDDNGEGYLKILQAAGIDMGLSYPIPVESEDEEDEDLMVGASGLRIETIDNIRFCDVDGVRIFEKDVLLGRL